MCLHEFLSIVDDKEKLIEYLIKHRIICEIINCPRCNSCVLLTRDLNNLLFYCHSIRYTQEKIAKNLLNLLTNTLQKVNFKHLYEYLRNYKRSPIKS